MAVRIRRIAFWLVVPVIVVVIGAALAVASVPALQWRLRVAAIKARGGLQDLSWSETLRWLRPSAPVWLRGVADTGNPYASIHNPDISPEAVAGGSALYATYCASCHGSDGRGATGPDLTTESSKLGSSDWALFRVITRGIPGTAMPAHPIPEKQVWRLVGYLGSLKTNRSEEQRSGAVRIDVPYERLLTAPTQPADWLTYSGSYAGWRYSGLKQVTPDNLSQLTLAWAQSISNGRERVQTSPVVVDGTMFVTEPPSNVIAIDCATGAVRWTYTREIPDGVQAGDGPQNRGVAVLDDKVFVATLDAHLVALDSATGAVVWDVTVADYRNGYSMTGVPLALKDRIVVGVAGGEYAVRGFIDAYHAESGKRLWRFDTVPGPGQPGHDTWAGDSWQTGGASTWLTGSFDPDLNLVYWGTGNPAPDFSGASRAGDNLYSDCVVALDADSGRLRWYFQFTPHDEHDWDAAQLPMLVDTEFDGARRKLLLWANKNGFYYVLDRVTGQYLRSRAFVAQTWAEGMDERGRPRLRSESSPSSRGAFTRPGAIGGTNWWPPSYSPETKLVYVPVTERGDVYTNAPLEFRPDGMFLGGASMPQSDYYHAVRALEPTTGRLRWEHRFSHDGTGMGGVLTTAGNVVFAGYGTRLYGLDARSGAHSWDVQLGDYIYAPPISFMIDGRQMIAVVTRRMLFTFALPETARDATSGTR